MKTIPSTAATSAWTRRIVVTAKMPARAVNVIVR
jgi:hypothetical protein